MSSPASPAPPRDRGGRSFLLLPAATFVVGLVLGGLVMWLGSSGRDGAGEGEPGPAATTAAVGEPSPAASPADRTVTVPGACVAAAERAQEVLDLAREAASAIAELDARRMQVLVNEMEDLEPVLRQSSQECQERAG